MAMSGHRSSQSPQLMHFSGWAQQAFSRSSRVRTSLGQNATQMPHPLHQSLLMTTLFFGFMLGLSEFSYVFGNIVIVETVLTILKRAYDSGCS
jgi:uncharacterized membrane protein YeiB